MVVGIHRELAGMDGGFNFLFEVGGNRLATGAIAGDADNKVKIGVRQRNEVVALLYLAIVKGHIIDAVNVCIYAVGGVRGAVFEREECRRGFGAAVNKAAFVIVEKTIFHITIPRQREIRKTRSPGVGFHRL